MRNPLLSLLLLLALVSCQPAQQEPVVTRKECMYQTDNSILRIYNDVLIELVEMHFYQYYLGDRLKDVPYDSTFNENTADSISYAHEKARIFSEYAKRQRKIFNRPDQWCTIYLDTAWTGISTLQDILKEVSKHNLNPRVQRFLEFEPADWNISHLDSFMTMQTDFTAKDFQSCTFRIAPASTFHKKYTDCYIGFVQFSKVVLNKAKTKAWLYYQFTCGGNCGLGEVLHLEKTGEKWKIKKAAHLWIA